MLVWELTHVTLQPCDGFGSEKSKHDVVVNCSESYLEKVKQWFHISFHCQYKSIKNYNNNSNKPKLESCGQSKNTIGILSFLSQQEWNDRNRM